MAKRKVYDDDDGRVVSKMNIDGMPWYTPPIPGESCSDSEKSDNYLTKSEEFWVFIGAMRAGLVVAGVCGLAMLITILLFLR